MTTCLTSFLLRCYFKLSDSLWTDWNLKILAGLAKCCWQDYLRRILGLIWFDSVYLRRWIHFGIAQGIHPLLLYGMELLVRFFFVWIYHLDFDLRKDTNMEPLYYSCNHHSLHTHFKPACTRLQGKNFKGQAHLIFLIEELPHSPALLPISFPK